MIVGRVRGSILIVAFCMVVFAATAQAQEKFTSSIDVLNGEKWWGVFVGSGREMPFESRFDMVDIANRDKEQTVPMLVSSRGRYIWSREPFTIEFTGDKFVIESLREKVQAISAGRNLREAYLVCVHKNLPPDGNVPSPGLFAAPIYDLTRHLGFGASADRIMECAQRIGQAGYPAGTLVIPSGWESSIGSLEVDKSLGDYAAVVQELHNKGYRVMFTVTPYVSPDGPMFRRFFDSGGMLTGEDGWPVLTGWAGGFSACYDVTDAGIFGMIGERLDALRSEYGVDGFLFDCKEQLPHLQRSRVGMDEYLRKWSELSAGYDFSEYTVSRGKEFAPMITNIDVNGEPGWEFLERSVQDIISAGMLGFPYTTIGAGGSEDISAADPKLLLRYMQLLTVLPVMNIPFAPWDVEDKEVAAACRDMVLSREKYASFYEQLLAESAKTAEPLIRHMEYAFPRNGFTDCNDQFMIGNRFMVAPLLTDSDTRMVRFPRGNWVDGKGVRIKGPVVRSVTSTDNNILVFELVK